MPFWFSSSRQLNFSILSCARIVKYNRMLQNPCIGCKCNSTSTSTNCNKDSVKSVASEFHNEFVEVFNKKYNLEQVKYKRLDDLSSKLKTLESSLTKSDGTLAKFLYVPPEVLTMLTSLAFTEIMHFLRTEHLSQLRKVFDDPESSDNDRFVSMQLLKNACISAGKLVLSFNYFIIRVLPGCQDTGTAIVIGKRGNQVFSENDTASIAKGVYDSYLNRNFRYSQMSPLSMYEEVNTKCNLPAQVELYSQDGTEYEFLFIAKGGGSANKTFLYQQTKSVLNENSLLDFLMDQIKTIGTSACPPYHLALVIGGLSAEMTLKTVKLASCKYLDNLPTEGNMYGNAFRDLKFEQLVLERTRTIGIGAQFGGKYFCHDVRVIRLPRHGASCPIGIGVSCSADRQVLAKINFSGVYLEELEHDPAQFLPTLEVGTSTNEIRVDLSLGMDKVLEQVRQYPVKTRLLLNGPLIVARDIAHAMLVEQLDKTGKLPDYMKDYPIYYAGPAKKPDGYVSGSFGPTTAGRMDSYAQKLMEKGASLITLAKGNRSRAFVNTCKKYGGVYLGSVGGPAALIAEDCITAVEVVDLPQLGMEAVHKIEVKDFPAFVVVDAKGNDFYAQWSKLLRAGHEELEHLEKVISILLNDRKKATGPKLITIELAINSLVEESQNLAKQCIELYKDTDGLRKKEIRFIAGQNEEESEVEKDESQVWSNYYSTIKGVKDYYKHNQHFNKTAENRNVQETVKRILSEINLDSVFSPDENYGRCVNLQDYYHTFINLQPLRNYRINFHRQREALRLRNKGLTDDALLETHMAPFSEMDYVTYVTSFDQFHLVPRYCKYRVSEYVKYLDDLLDYLQNFFKKQNPLANHELLLKQMEDTFESNWNNQVIQHWKEPTELMDLYLRPVDKLFSSEGLLNSFKSGKKYKTVSEAFSKKTSDELELLSLESRSHDKMIANKEFLIQSFKEVLNITLEKTVEFVQKRESRTVKELETSQTLAQEILDALENEQQQSDPEEEEEEKPVYNPLNLPLGWDGKPIPFWLYKLHGLGQEFKCEICGNYSYWGRKAFENHFQEWRHSFGMKCLKIPNTPHFKEITKIEDAFALYDKLRNNMNKQTFKISQEAECEDSEGNLMSLKAYEDLKRQGLL